MSKDLTKVVTGKACRFSYCHVFEPHAMEEGQTPKFSVAILIPKTDTETIAKIKVAIEEAAKLGKSKFGDKFNATKTPLRDGDIDRPGDENYAGHFFVNANSTTKPGVVDKNLNPILDKEEFYSGCYGRASITFYPFNVTTSKGIAAGLNNLQKLDEGEKLAGGSSAQEDFGSDEDMMG